MQDTRILLSQYKIAGALVLVGLLLIAGSTLTYQHVIAKIKYEISQSFGDNDNSEGINKVQLETLRREVSRLSSLVEPTPREIKRPAELDTNLLENKIVDLERRIQAISESVAKLATSDPTGDFEVEDITNSPPAAELENTPEFNQRDTNAFNNYANKLESLISTAEPNPQWDVTYTNEIETTVSAFQALPNLQKNTSIDHYLCRDQVCRIEMTSISAEDVYEMERMLIEKLGSSLPYIDYKNEPGADGRIKTVIYLTDKNHNPTPSTIN